MKEDILNLLYSSPNYISGEEISLILGVTRSSVWKHINNLKKDGYIIEGISNKGYKLISSPSSLNEFELKKSLSTDFIGQNIYIFDKVFSTNILAKEYAEKGEMDGTLILSNTQSGGLGRLERVWNSPLGGLWFSLILKPHCPPINASKVPLIAAASIYKALKKFNVSVEIKWPNDIILNGKKLGGILTQMSCELDSINYIILGIGLNINVLEKDFDKTLLHKATSLLIEGNKSYSLKYILLSILEEFELLYKELLETGEIKTSLDICKNNSCIIGKDVSISNSITTLNGKAIDLSSRGGLIIKLENGTTKEIMSGEVSLSSFYK